MVSADSQRLIMAHALQRVLCVTADTMTFNFALVARNPGMGAEGIYGHVFQLPSKEKVTVEVRDAHMYVIDAINLLFLSHTV